MGIASTIDGKVRGRVIWITGLSGSGKSTLACGLVRRLRVTNDSVVLLDGDELRGIFGAEVVNRENHGREGRLELAMRYANLCCLLASQGFIVVIATISLFKEVHSWNRIHLPGYFEVYLDVPLDELRKRDPKGIYRQFYNGDLTQVAGLDIRIDEPEEADLIMQFESGSTKEKLADNLLDQLENKGFL